MPQADKFSAISGKLRKIFRNHSSLQFLTISNILTFALCITYAWAFFAGLSPYWFHPDWTTDDALQQLYPFYSVLYPGRFDGDLITLMMSSYLAPLHYWLGAGFTILSGDPIMAGHWLMLLQVGLSVGFVFLAVRHAAGLAPALFAVTWLLHTRHVMQRMTGGLPRGWAAPVFAAFLYFVLKGNHRAVLATILLGCFLHPPATLTIAACYGMLLVWRVCLKQTRETHLVPLRNFVIASPLFIVCTLSVVTMPEEIGSMASYEVASQMPEFSYPKGRFPFVPLRDAESEIRAYGFQTFVGRFYTPPKFWRKYTPEFVIGLFALFLFVGFARRRRTLPAEFFFFLVATLAVYFASRMFAFKLYVPNRHLQFPLAFFFVTAMTIAAWRAFYRGPAQGPSRQLNAGCPDMSFKSSWASLLALCVIGLSVYAASGTGLYGAANFNYSRDKKGGVFRFLEQHTPPDALIAGEPTHIDGVQLFAARKAFATTETAHPFYDRYYAEIRRRMEVSLRAHYAKSLPDLVRILEPEGVDFFVFEREEFYPDRLASVSYYEPLDALVKELAAGDTMAFAFRELPRHVDLERFPAMPFRDNGSVVVDIARLKAHLEAQGRL